MADFSRRALYLSYGGATRDGNFFARLSSRRAPDSLRVPRARAVVLLRHPLLDGDTQEDLLRVPIPVRSRNSKPFANARVLETKKC